MTTEPAVPLDDDVAAAAARTPDEPKPVRNKPRLVPAPWLDCESCGWRHYPSQMRGGKGWALAPVCTSCGAELVPRLDPADA